MVAAGGIILASDVIPVLTPCMVMMNQQTAQTGWTSATMTAVTFGTSSEVFDTDNLHDTGSNTSRVVIGGRLGYWLISGVYCPPSNSATTGIRVTIGKNGTPVVGSFAGQTVSSTTSLLGIAANSVLVQATVSTDYVELFGYQTAASGTIGTVGLNSYVSCTLSAIWLRA